MNAALAYFPTMPSASPAMLLALAAVFFFLVLPILFRTVVSTNDVHIVQSAKKTVSYGKDQPAGNTYYAWPAWMPLIGVRTIVLPVSVFSINLTDYAAYDKDRLPFIIDIIGFFRIDNSNEAAQRIASFDGLVGQLKGILQGAIRSILASSEINAILEGRAEFGQRFTTEVNTQLKQWGVTTVKNIELMDIRDAGDSKVIANMMAMKKSEVESRSRIEVAGNMQRAQQAEIDARREVGLREQEAAQQINVRTAEQQKQTHIANEQAKQAIADQAKTTAEKSMAVQQVNDVRSAEIAKQVQVVQVVQASQQKEVGVVKAEGTKQQTVLIAEGDLAGTKLRAEGVLAEGTAKAEAEKLMQLAPVQAQITLAKEIGANQPYQTYLISIRQIEAGQTVGIAQAGALEKAEIKVIANAGTPIEGVKSAMDLLTPRGGLQIGAAIEAFANTDVGKTILAAVGPKANGATPAAKPPTT